MSDVIDIKEFARKLVTDMHLPGSKARALLEQLCSANGYDKAEAFRVLEETLSKINFTDAKEARINENISRKAKDYIIQTDGRYFDLTNMDAELGIKTPEQKQARKQAIYRFKTDGLIEPHPKIDGKYRYINRDAEKLDWLNADPNNTLNLRWPHDAEGNCFGLENVKIYPGSVIVIAGVSNMGKTTFCIGFMLENMDDYHCIYMSNELGNEEFKARMDKYEWVELLKEDGIPKFEAVIRYDNYQDIIQPDAINIIDYLDPGENPYTIGIMIDQIKQKLSGGKGIALIAIQKGVTTITTKNGVIHQSKEYGVGGQFSEHRARLVLHIDMGVLWVKKCKSWHTSNPNNKRYSFEIGNHGAAFLNIKEMKDEPEATNG